MPDPPGRARRPTRFGSSRTSSAGASLGWAERPVNRIQCTDADPDGGPGHGRADPEARDDDRGGGAAQGARDRLRATGGWGARVPGGPGRIRAGGGGRGDPPPHRRRGGAGGRGGGGGGGGGGP